ncbi:MAG: class I SAM-dependent methyltransferase, partial [Planctomycetota bacterium]|nr:class I SAM-dependent methyltransferase [Planctomycetota bacterium]
MAAEGERGLNWYEWPLERGLFPDWMIRLGIRHRLADRLARERAGGIEAMQARKRAFVESLRRSPVAIETAAANEQHYELPPAFFEAFLGPRLKYSSAYWDADTRSLAEAEERMLGMCCARAGIEDGMEVLDRGCGWGSMSMWIAEKFPKCRVTGVSNSAGQKRFIEGRCRERGIGNVEIVTADANEFEPGKTFDRIVSIEMFEHMKNYGELLRRVSSWLRPEGRLFVHIFTHLTVAYPYERETDWSGR